MVIEYLIAKEHTRVGFIAGAREYALSQWRKDGWLANCAFAGDRPDLVFREDLPEGTECAF